MTSTTIDQTSVPATLDFAEDRCESKRPGISATAAGFYGFVSVLLGVISFGIWGAGIPAPLLALMGAAVGFIVVRRTLKRPELASERRFARVGMWIGVTNLVLVALALIIGHEQTTFASFG
jgi:hypothetical protein